MKHKLHSPAIQCSPGEAANLTGQTKTMLKLSHN